MFKRILVLAATAALGAIISANALRREPTWSIFPNRDLDHSAAYVKDMLKMVNENYVDPQAVGYDDLARHAIHGMVESLDPHSEYLEAKDSAELEEDLDGEFGGIGIEVETGKDKVVVVTPMAGSPGEKAGILRGDEIVSIDGRAVGRDDSMNTVVDQLRGKPHTQVKVGIFRPSANERKEFSLVREMIKIESVRGARVLDGQTGYIQITEFSEHTGEQFTDAVNGLLKQNIDSLIIDLRNNPGGLLDAAVEVAEPFFKKGELIVYTQGRKPADREDFLAEDDDAPLDIPIAVLINAGTASAAEIVTGALKDTGRAIIVGERSFGKGSVQSIFKLKNGEEMRLTTAHYYTPSGRTIHQKGIDPQIEVVMTPEEDGKLREQASRPDLLTPLEVKEHLGFYPVTDRQLDAARDALKAVRIIDGRDPSQKKLSERAAPAVHTLVSLRTLHDPRLREFLR